MERRLTLTEQPVGQELSDEEKTADAPRQNILPSPSNDFEEGSQEDLTAPSKNFEEGGQKNLTYNNIYNNTNNTALNNTSERKAHAHFNIPTVEQVKNYCMERGNNIDAEQFVDYYTSNGWKVGKNQMRDWQAAVRRWERNSEFNCPQQGSAVSRSSGGKSESADGSTKYNQAKKSAFHNFEQRHYDSNELDKLYFELNYGITV